MRMPTPSRRRTAAAPGSFHQMSATPPRMPRLRVAKVKKNGARDVCSMQTDLSAFDRLREAAGPRPTGFGGISSWRARPYECVFGCEDQLAGRKPTQAGRTRFTFSAGESIDTEPEPRRYDAEREAARRKTEARRWHFDSGPTQPNWYEFLGVPALGSGRMSRPRTGTRSTGWGPRALSRRTASAAGEARAGMGDARQPANAKPTMQRCHLGGPPLAARRLV